MEKKITIAADINGDIPGCLADEYGIVILPQYYRFDMDEMVYGDERRLSASEFFARMSGGERAFSMGCNPQRVRELLEPRLAAGEELICIMFSSALSGSYNTVSMVADQLREEYPESRIQVIDTRNASFGQGILACRAAKRCLEGGSFEEIVQAVEDVYKRQGPGRTASGYNCPHQAQMLLLHIGNMRWQIRSAPRAGSSGRQRPGWFPPCHLS